MADINIYGVLHNDTPDNVIARAEQVSIESDKLESTNVQDALEELAAGGGGEGGSTVSYDVTNESMIIE